MDDVDIKVQLLVNHFQIIRGYAMPPPQSIHPEAEVCTCTSK